MPLTNLTNLGTSVTYQKDCYIRLESQTKIVNTVLDGSVSIGSFSTVTNSSIGKYFNLGSHSFVTRTEIGRFVSIGSRVSIGGLNHPTDWLSISEFQYQDTSDCFGETLPPDMRVNLTQKNSTRVLINSDVWIGDNSVILSSVSLPLGTIIGAGSVVTKTPAEPFLILAGNPAKPIRARFNEKTISKIIESKWWDYNISDLPPNLPFNKPFLAASRFSDH